MVSKGTVQSRPSRPHRAHWLVRWYAKLMIKLTGWQIDMSVGYDLPSYVMFSVPHTSNWDFLMAAMTLGKADLRSSIAIKDDWTRLPILGRFIETLGGVGIDRSGSKNVVDQIVEMFNEDPQFVIIITPEGTRNRVQYWKTGFYHIALQAGVPILLGYVDYGRKVGGIAPIIVYPSGDIESDINEFREFIMSITPRNPENRSPIRFKDK